MARNASSVWTAVRRGRSFGAAMHPLKAFVASTVLALPLCTLAAEQTRNCDSPEKGVDLIACAAARHQAADAKLNAAYRQLEAVLRKQGDPILEQRLQVAQGDWLRFQSSHCELEASYEGAGGSYLSAKVADCLAETTDERTKQLERLLAYFK